MRITKADKEGKKKVHKLSKSVATYLPLLLSTIIRSLAPKEVLEK